MLFNSLHFLLFFPVVAVLYYLIPGRAKWVWLLAASYYFYMSWNPKYALLLALSTLVTWGAGLLISRAAAAPARRLWLAASFAVNLGILFFFKYFNFAAASLSRVLAAVGVEVLTPAFDVLLPVGISFYTFQALGYTVDVYRGEAPERHLGRYALFVSFFPQLVAGPIERGKNLLAQLRSPRPFSYDNVKNGLLLMLWGYFEKMVVADRAAAVVDAVFAEHALYAGPQMVVAALLFAAQIYGDFAGYSHIAIGAARVMGYDLMENFRQPYLAASIREFWHRWHISLSTWFRDYLYIPLGGSHRGRPRKYLNLMLTFLASGLWHGANWTFAAWGGLHGAWQVLGDALAPYKRRLYARLRLDPEKGAARAARALCTFVLVDFAWILFRAPGLRAFFDIVRSMFDWSAAAFSPAALGLNGWELGILLGALALLAAADLLRNRRSPAALLAAQKTPVRWLCYYALLYIVLRFGVFGTGYAPPQFIYFQF